MNMYTQHKGKATGVPSMNEPPQQEPAVAVSSDAGLTEAKNRATACSNAPENQQRCAERQFHLNNTNHSMPSTPAPSETTAAAGPLLAVCVTMLYTRRTDSTHQPPKPRHQSPHRKYPTTIACVFQNRRWPIVATSCDTFMQQNTD